jgi:hypothetical protein
MIPSIHLHLSNQLLLKSQNLPSFLNCPWLLSLHSLPLPQTILNFPSLQLFQSHPKIQMRLSIQSHPTLRCSQWLRCFPKLPSGQCFQ